MWSVGCIFAELRTADRFAGKDRIETRPHFQAMRNSHARELAGRRKASAREALQAKEALPETIARGLQSFLSVREGFAREILNFGSDEAHLRKRGSRL